MRTSIEKNERRLTQRNNSLERADIVVSHVQNGLLREIGGSSIDHGEMGIGVFVRESIPSGDVVSVVIKECENYIKRSGTVRWTLPSIINIGSEGAIEGFKLGIQLDPVEKQPNRRLSYDRRQPGPWFNRRNTNRREKEFLIDHHVFLSDTNLVGNTYFAKHFEWQGHVREAFLFHVVNFPEFVKLGIKLITKEASCEYMSESTLGDPIALILRVGKVSHVRLELLFTFIHKISGKVVSKGRQVIVFGGPNGKPVGIPSMILKGIAPYR